MDWILFFLSIIMTLRLYKRHFDRVSSSASAEDIARSEQRVFTHSVIRTQMREERARDRLLSEQVQDGQNQMGIAGATTGAGMIVIGDAAGGTSLTEITTGEVDFTEIVENATGEVDFTEIARNATDETGFLEITESATSETNLIEMLLSFMEGLG